MPGQYGKVRQQGLRQKGEGRQWMHVHIRIVIDHIKHAPNTYSAQFLGPILNRKAVRNTFILRTLTCKTLNFICLHATQEIVAFRNSYNLRQHKLDPAHST